MAESKQNDQRLRKEKFNRRLDRRERLRRRKRDMTRVRYVGRGINPAQVRRLRALKRDSDVRDTFFKDVVDTGPDFVIGRKYKHDYGPGFSYKQVRMTPKLETKIRGLFTPESPIEELEKPIRVLEKYDKERAKLEEEELEKLPYGQNGLGVLMLNGDGELIRTETKDEAEYGENGLGVLVFGEDGIPLSRTETKEEAGSPALPRAPEARTAPLLPRLQDSELASSPSGRTPRKTKSQTPVFKTPGFQSVIL